MKKEGGKWYTLRSHWPLHRTEENEYKCEFRWNCQGSLFTLFCAAIDAAEAVGYRYDDRLDDGRSLLSDCVIDWAFKLETKRRGEGNIGISMGIYCQWGFSALWIDGGRRANRMNYAFSCRLAGNPSALVWWNDGTAETLAGPLAAIDGSHKTLVGRNKSSWKQSFCKTKTKKDTK